MKDFVMRYVFPIQLTILFLAYFLTARLGLSFYAVNNFATLVWPPTGIALAALVFYGYRLWPAIFVAAFFANFSIGAMPLVALGIAFGNTLEAVVGSYLLKRAAPFDPSFGSLRDSVNFIIIGALFAPIISASIGTSALLLGGGLTFVEVSHTWLTWWIGDMLGALVIGPLLLVWLHPIPVHIQPRKLIEAMAVAAFLLGLSYMVFWRPFSFLERFPYLYPVILPLAWAALRFGVRGKTLAMFVTSTMAIGALATNHIGLTSASIDEYLLYLQIFIATIAAMFLVFGSIIEERRRNALTLVGHVGNLEEALKKIRFEDEAKREFLALLAHELRNPLAPVMSGLEILREEHEVHGEAKKLVDMMHQQVKTMIRLIDDLLDISRISQKKLHLKKETVELSVIVRQAAKTVEPLYKKQKHVFSLVLPKEPIWFEADPVRLEQIVVNVLTNAGKYTSPYGNILCKVSNEDGMLVISIKDSGVGIESSMLERVFEPFLQGERMKGSEGAGIGVGLSLSKYLVEMHGGMIEAYSEGRDQGSEFVIRLPLTRRTAPVALKKHSSTARSFAPAKGILIVDDNESAAHALEKLLRLKGHEVHSIYTGKEVRAEVEKHHPEAILLDIGLPDTTGYDVARELRAEGFSGTLIALTGYGQEDDKQRARDAGFDHHLTKPVSIADLEALLS